MAYLKLIYTCTLFFLSLTPIYTSFSQTSDTFTVYVVLRLDIGGNYHFTSSEPSACLL